jgi:hypothetical protein
MRWIERVDAMEEMEATHFGRLDDSVVSDHERLRGFV